MIKILQINLNRSKEAHDMLTDIASRKRIDICLMSEPNKRTTQHNDKYHADIRTDTAIWWTGNNRTHTPRETGHGDGFTWINIHNIGIIYSCYFSPNRPEKEFEQFLNNLKENMKQHNTKNIIITGDFNATSTTWGGKQTLPRGQRMEEWIAENNLFISNNGTTPTFNRRDQESFIDLTLATGHIYPDITQWTVEEEEISLSDHRYITFSIKNTPNPNHKEPASRRRKIIRFNTLNVQTLNTAFRQEYNKEHGQRDEHTLLKIIDKSCKKAKTIRETPHKSKHTPKYWWNDEIAEIREKCVRLRRALTKHRTWRKRHETQCGTNNNTNNAHWDRFKEGTRELKERIQKSKREHWKQLIEEVETDKWGKPYKIVMNKIKRRPPTLPPDIITDIVNALFPQQIVTTREHTNNTEIQPPDVTLDEIEQARDRLAPGKAPGPDGIPSEVLRTLIKHHPEVFKDLANTLFKQGRFPTCWKEAALVLIRKPGQKTGPSAYRPICLLNTTAKFMENIIVARLHDELETKNLLSDTQYGFRRHRGTVGAIKRVLNIAEAELTKTLKTRNFVLLILLDVRNAFNTMKWDVILSALERKGISTYLRRIISSYLQDRALHTDHSKREVTAGVPQGSVLGPVLWNIGYDEVLRVGLPDGAERVAYADDLALIIKARTEEELQHIANESLEILRDWMENNGLDLAPEKSEATYLTGRKKRRGIDLRLGGAPVKIKDSVKYLGVFLDRGLSGKTHIDYVSKKSSLAAHNLAKLMPRTRGPAEDTRRLLASVSESIAMYAAPVWAGAALRTARNRAKLLSAQRITAIRVSRAYSTVATAAVLVLARMIPWDLLAAERVERHDRDVHFEQARAATMNKWQQQWVQSPADGPGAWTRAIIADVRSWCERAYGELSYYTTQVLTGHGQFQTYMVKIGKTGSDTCVLCATGETDDVEHTLLHCEALASVRYKSEYQSLADKGIKELVAKMLSSEEEWTAVTGFFDNVMKQKETLEKSRRKTFQDTQRQ